MSSLRYALESTLVRESLAGSTEEYIAFDLDGTIAKYDGWKGIEHIGEPIEKTVNMIKQFLQQGVRVKILTARMATDNPTEREYVRNLIARWSEQHIGQALEATCVKDRFMVRLYDDRARQVIENTGEVITVQD